MTEELSEDARRVLGYIRGNPFREFEQIQSSVGLPKRKLYDILYEPQSKGLISMTGDRQESLLSDMTEVDKKGRNELTIESR